MDAKTKTLMEWLALFVAAFSFVTLAVPLAEAYGVRENGFVLLDFRSIFLADRGAEISFALFMWIHLLAAISCVVLDVACFWLPRGLADRIRLATVSIAFGLSGLYLIIGIALAALGNAARATDTLVTYAFIPTIITAELWTLFFVCYRRTRYGI